MCIHDFRTYINADVTYSAVSHPQRPNTSSANISLFGPFNNPNVTVGAFEADWAPSTFEVDEDNAFFNSFGLQELLPSLNNFMWTSSAYNTDPNVTQPPYFPPNYNPGFGSGFCGWNSAQAVIIFANTVLYPVDGTGLHVRAGTSSSFTTQAYYVSNSYDNSTVISSPLDAVTFDPSGPGLNGANKAANALAAAITSSNGQPSLISCSISTTTIDGDTLTLTNIDPGSHANNFCFDFIEKVDFLNGIVSMNSHDAIAINAGQEVCFEDGHQPGCQCSWTQLDEGLETKDMLNNCVQMNYFFVGSSSFHCDYSASMAAGNPAPTQHNHPTWKVETSDGHVCYVTRDQEFLVWDGGGTTDNHWEKAEDLVPQTPQTFANSDWLLGNANPNFSGSLSHGWNNATKLVCWQNDVYGYVRVKLSYDDTHPHDGNSTYGGLPRGDYGNNLAGLHVNPGYTMREPQPDIGRAVHWMTTGTNSFQLANRIVVRGWRGEMCSCAPTTNIDDIRCGTTKSCCVNSSGSGQPASLTYNQFMTTTTQSAFSILSWSLHPHTESIDYDVNWHYPKPGDKRQVTMSISTTNDSNFQVCLTEWAPVEQICEPQPESLLPQCPSCGDTSKGVIGDLYNLHPATMSITHYQAQDSYGGFNHAAGTFLDYQLGNTPGVGVSGSKGSNWSIVFLSQSGTSPQTESYYYHNYEIASGSATASTALPAGNESYSYWDPQFTSSTHYRKASMTTSFFYIDSAGPGTRWAESLAFAINKTWDNKEDFPAFPVAEFNPIANGLPMGMGHTSTSLNGLPNEFITLRTTGCHNYWSLSPLGNEALPFEPYRMSYTPHMDLLQDNGIYESIVYATGAVPIVSYSGVGNNHLATFYPESESFANSGSFCAEQKCCFDLIINKEPSWNSSESLCQETPGRVINVTQLFNVIDFDDIEWYGPMGMEIPGNMSAAGELKFDPFTGLVLPVDQFFTVDDDVMLNGTASLCFTASVSNSLCWNDASCDYSHSLYHPTTSYTPDCCADISGCSTVYLNPGVSAGPDQIICLPTLSVHGQLTSQQPMGTPWPLQGLPTWSFEGEHGTWTANILTPHSFSTDVIIEDYSPGITPLHVTASGIFTMSLTVPHGPCEYTDHMYFEIVEQSSSILPAQVECVNIDSDYRTFITASQPSPSGYGNWTVAAPDAYTASAAVTIYSPSKFTTQVQIPLDTTITFLWTRCEIFSSSLDVSSNDTQSGIADIVCCGSESIDVTITAQPQAPVLLTGVMQDCPGCGAQTASFVGELNAFTAHASWSANFTTWTETHLTDTYIAFSSSTPPFTSGTIINSSSNHYLGTDTPTIPYPNAPVGNQVVWENALVTSQVPTIYPWTSSTLVFSSSNANAYGKDIEILLMARGLQGVCDVTQSTTISFPLPIQTESFAFVSGGGFYPWEEPYYVNFDPAQTSSAGIFNMPKLNQIVGMTFRSGGIDILPTTHSNVMAKQRNVPAPYLTGALGACLSTGDVEPPSLLTEGGSFDTPYPTGTPTADGQTTWTPASTSAADWALPWPTNSAGQTDPSIIIPTPSGGLGAYGVNFEWNARTVALYGITHSSYNQWHDAQMQIHWHHVASMSNDATSSAGGDVFTYMYVTQSNSNINEPAWLTGSFADTGTSRSFQQVPTFFPPNRNINHIYGWTNYDGSNYNNNAPFARGLLDFNRKEQITSVSIMFEVTASYTSPSCDERFYSSMSIMFTNQYT